MPVSIRVCVCFLSVDWRACEVSSVPEMALFNYHTATEGYNLIYMHDHRVKLQRKFYARCVFAVVFT